MSYNKDELLIEWYKDNGCCSRNFSDALFEDIVLDEAKQDIQNFIDKFGADTYNLFKKSTQRLKNAGRSTDLTYYVKNVSKKELDNILSKLERKLSPGVVNNTDGIRGRYKYLGAKKGFKVYQPFDAQSSMDLGYMTGWCTTGRYGHAGERNYKPSLEHAEEHFGQYTNQGVKFYYFLNRKMEGQYAIAVYPNVIEIDVDEPVALDDNYYLTKANFEIYDQQDELDYSALKKLPLDLLPDEVDLSYETAEAITDLVIPDGIKCVDASVMSKVTLPERLERVVIPDSVTSIGECAFRRCSSLTSITLSDGVKSIGYAAFFLCTSLTSIALPSSVTSIGDSAFSYCSSLTSITIPDSVTSIGYRALRGCSSLSSITLPFIGDTAGSNQYLGYIFGASSYYDNSSYVPSSLKEVIVSDKCTSIGECAFGGCSSLTSIIIPDSVTSIGKYAFGGCRSLTSITIPDSVTDIGEFAFAGCSRLIVKTNNKYVQKYCDKQQIRCEKLSNQETINTR